MTVVLILGLGLVLGAVTWGLGRAGASVVTLAAAPTLPLAGGALWFAATNAQAPVGQGFDEPGLSGAAVGGMLALLSAPMWVGGFFMGRKARKGNV